NVGIAIVVVIQEDPSEPIVLVLEVGNPGAAADLRKSAIAIVVIKRISLAWQAARAAKDAGSFEAARRFGEISFGRIVDVKVDVARHVEVNKTILVVIAKS